VKERKQVRQEGSVVLKERLLTCDIAPRATKGRLEQTHRRSQRRNAQTKPRCERERVR
jgi:hypothetical protein